MKKLILSLALIVGMAISMNAQNAKGDWYVGTGDVANVAWTDWAISPTLGYGVSDKLMVGLGLAQADSTETYTKMHSDSTKTMEIDRRGLYNFNFMWANLDNWTQGGKSNLNGTVMLREQFKIKTENTTSSHLMMLNYGLNNQDQITSKTIDNIQYVGNFARGGIGDKRWARISTQLELNSQIMPGYENGDTVKTNMISRIASPLYAQVSLGAISNKFKSWSLYCAPIGSKTTIILDSAIRESGAFGIDSTSSSLFQGGANATLTFNKIYFGSLRILLRTDFFYNYLNDNPALDVRVEIS